MANDRVKLTLFRHGQSQWNFENRFTGWTDVDLTDQGIEEARSAGRALNREDCDFDIAYTSVLKRAIETLWIVLKETDLMWIPVIRSWRLNERHYGALQGLYKQRIAEQYGEEQVHAWRRGYATAPPPLADDDPRHPRFDPRYARFDYRSLPATESLADTLARFLPLWQDRIALDLRAGKNVLIAAHGNSLRALVKMLESVADDDIVHVETPTGIPIVYTLTPNLKIIDKAVLGKS